MLDLNRRWDLGLGLGRPKVDKQETQLFGSPPWRHLEFSLSSLGHNPKLIQSERRRREQHARPLLDEPAQFRNAVAGGHVTRPAALKGGIYQAAPIPPTRSS